MLVELAKLTTAREEGNENLRANLKAIKAWSEQKRYHLGITEAEATVLVNAIEDPADGVPPWLKTFS